uniref:hypothetical protein n=1 Tax=Succinivibrio sp. TaxID=2053619 RepID=UPI00402ABF41
MYISSFVDATDHVGKAIVISIIIKADAKFTNSVVYNSFIFNSSWSFTLVQ